MKRSIRDLKQLAREKLQGKYGTFIAANVILSAITFAVIFLPSLFFQNTFLSGALYQQIIAALLSLLLSVMSVGILYISLNASRDKAIIGSDLFYCFGHHPDRIIVVAFVNLLLALFLLIPNYLLTVNWTDAWLSDGNLYSIWLLLLTLIAGTIITYILRLPFRLSYYLLLDNDQLSAIEAMRTSIRLMKGNKTRLFILDISFIGYRLLGMLSLGIGSLWVTPYIGMTTAQFYREIIGELDVHAFADTTDNFDFQAHAYPNELF